MKVKGCRVRSYVTMERRVYRSTGPTDILNSDTAGNDILRSQDPCKFEELTGTRGEKLACLACRTGGEGRGGTIGMCTVVGSA